jgi:hypothetical protein
VKGSAALAMESASGQRIHVLPRLLLLHFPVPHGRAEIVAETMAGRSSWRPAGQRRAERICHAMTFQAPGRRGAAGRGRQAHAREAAEVQASIAATTCARAHQILLDAFLPVCVQEMWNLVSAPQLTVMHKCRYSTQGKMLHEMDKDYK